MEMTAEETLAQFLSKALLDRWRDRYLSLVQTKRGKKTFVEDLWHQLEDRLDPAKSVPDLPAEVWASPAFSYSQNNGFGKEEESVRVAFDTVGDGSLIVDKTGRHGIHQPEDMVDDIRYFRV